MRYVFSHNDRIESCTEVRTRLILSTEITRETEALNETGDITDVQYHADALRTGDRGIWRATCL